MLTLTNDLGDDYFFGNADLQVAIQSHSKDHAKQDIIKQALLKWTPGMRACKCSVKFSTSAKVKSIQVKVDVTKSENHLDPDVTSYFVPLFSVAVDLKGSYCTSEKLAIRKMLLSDNSTVEVTEETGESIARHVWDAGLAMTQLLPGDWVPKFETPSPKIIELGSGCGLVGIALARLFPKVSLTLTDLDDATEVCTRNLRLNQVPNAKFECLDWDERQNLSSDWDLVVATDCTYNTDSYNALLDTLDCLVGPRTTVLIAHKNRHEAEHLFFSAVADRFTLQSDTYESYHGQKVRVITFTR